MANDDVKDEIDAQSGRFEFLKQALTLGLAGLAGTAALFTDPSKIPSGAWAIGAVVGMGLTLLATVGASLMGLSVYANLLKAHADAADATGFKASIITHARSVFVAIGLTAVAFTTYAGAQLVGHKEPRITSVEALGIARRAMAASGCDGIFETLSEHPRVSVTMTFQSETCHRRYAVEVQEEGGALLSISPVATPPAAPALPGPGQNLVRQPAASGG